MEWELGSKRALALSTTTPNERPQKNSSNLSPRCLLPIASSVTNWFSEVRHVYEDSAEDTREHQHSYKVSPINMFFYLRASTVFLCVSISSLDYSIAAETHLQVRLNLRV